MSEFMKDGKSSEIAVLKIANNELAKEKAIAEQLLGHVLLEIGEPVYVPKSKIKKGFEKMTIDITEDDEFFVFSLVKIKDD